MSFLERFKRVQVRFKVIFGMEASVYTEAFKILCTIVTEAFKILCTIVKYAGS